MFEDGNFLDVAVYLAPPGRTVWWRQQYERRVFRQSSEFRKTDSSNGICHHFT